MPLSVMGETPETQVDWQELTRSECFDLLANEQLGRVAVMDDFGPIVIPVNFVLDRHTVLFRTDEGTKLDAAATRGRVAFEVDATDPGDAHRLERHKSAVRLSRSPTQRSWRACATCRSHRGRQVPRAAMCASCLRH